MSDASTAAPLVYRRGDVIEVVSVPKGREKRLKVGQRGEVVVDSDAVEFGWCSAVFDGSSYPLLLRPSHVRLLARAAAQEADAVAAEVE
jgi:hypothetical protein